MGEAKANAGDIVGNADAPSRPRIIVAEISRGYMDGHPNDGSDEPMASRFERVIHTNSQRGYDLLDWRFATSVAATARVREDSEHIYLNETIIATFKRRY